MKRQGQSILLAIVVVSCAVGAISCRSRTPDTSNIKETLTDNERNRNHSRDSDRFESDGSPAQKIGANGTTSKSTGSIAGQTAFNINNGRLMVVQLGKTFDPQEAQSMCESFGPEQKIWKLPDVDLYYSMIVLLNISYAVPVSVRAGTGEFANAYPMFVHSSGSEGPKVMSLVDGQGTANFALDLKKELQNTKNWLQQNSPSHKKYKLARAQEQALRGGVPVFCVRGTLSTERTP